jgi:MFS family permease
VIVISFKRLWETIKDIRRYGELFKYLIAFLIYIDGIGTIIGVAVIYGAELGFGSIELIAALLLVQFVGIPYSLIFGRLPSKNEKRRPFYLAFVLFNIIALPLVGIIGSRLLPPDVAGAPPAPFTGSDSAVGTGTYASTDAALSYSGSWETETAADGELGDETEVQHRVSTQADARLIFSFTGRNLEIVHSTGPDHGVWTIELDGEALLDEDTGEPVTIDAYNETVRYGVVSEIIIDEAGEHTMVLANSSTKNPASKGYNISIAKVIVLPPTRESNLLLIVGLIVAVQVIGLVLAFFLGKPLFNNFVESIDTRRGILIALFIYIVISIWGYFLDSVVEFWFLAWMVAVVQGGSQALSRSLFSSMAPSAKSGEFFGLFGIMEKFSAIVGPLVFAWAATTFGSSRPAVLSIVAFFILGGLLLTLVDVDEGRRIAQEEDAALLASR